MIFQPVNMMGPAHRGPQLQQLAQKAAQNVMQRQRLRTMLRTSAGAARGAAPGGGQGLMTAQRGVHTVLSQHAPNMPNQGLASMFGGAPASPMDTPGQYNPSGGGADFSSIPDPNDPGQSPAAVQGLPPGWSFGGAPPNVGNGGANGGGSLFVPNNGGTPSTGPAGGGGTMNPGGGLIPLNGGLFYDPATDSVVGGGGNSLGRGTQ